MPGPGGAYGAYGGGGDDLMEGMEDEMGMGAHGGGGWAEVGGYY